MLTRLAEAGSWCSKVSGKGTIVVGHEAGRSQRSAISVELIIDNTDSKLDANEYAFDCLRRIQSSALTMRPAV